MTDTTNAAINTLSSHPAVGHSLRDVVSGLTEAQSLCFDLASHAGWHDKPREVGTMLCLVHSEISEAMEGHRKGKQDDHLPHRSAFEVELADALIRILDLAGKHNLDLAGAAIEKLAYNAQRADHTREARALFGGKAY